MNVLAPLFMAAAVAAAGDQAGFDMRCMVATQMAHQQVEGELKAATMLSVMFFFGRVDASMPPAELERALDAETAALKGQPLGALLQQCGRFMEGRGKALEAIGARLEAKERAGQIG